MKLTLALTVALLACAAAAQAQTASIGVKAGLNFADLSFSGMNDPANPKSLTGLVAGGEEPGRLDDSRVQILNCEL
jgi:hypothetical protein